jgi:dipeptidyl aminopeptidase/acylaminoacyl peptidase
MAAPLLALSVAMAPLAAGAEPLSVADAFGRDGIVSMRLSPDEKQLLSLVHVGGGGVGILLIDTETLTPRFIVKPLGEWIGPRDAFWVTDQIVAINDGRTGGYLLDLRTMRQKPLRGVFMRNVSPGPDGHARVLVIRDRDHFDRVDVENGDSAPMNFDIPSEHHGGYVLDRNGVPLVATTVDESHFGGNGAVTHWYRSGLDHKWEKLVTFPASRVEWRPLFVHPDGRSIGIVAEVDRDTQAIFRYDPSEHRIAELMAGHPTQDIRLLPDAEHEDEFVGATTFGMKPQVYWFEPKRAALQRALDAALPDAVNLIGGSRLGRSILVYSYSDVDPGRWLLLDTQSMSLRLVGSHAPKIDSDAMSPTRIVSYRSLDGLEIPAYLTRPKGATGSGPAVLLIHGGPVARDDWQFDPFVQLLVGRGYAVLQPQFRGSAGFGKRFREAGYGQWGRAMQDDVTAGAEWLAAQGYADRDRMCIFGGSYGGFAAMSALVKTPQLFKCGISLAGVSDLKALLTSDTDTSESRAASEMQRVWIGDAKQQNFDAVSPLKNVRAIEAPMLIAHGALDRRVPPEQSRDMVAAMRKEGKSVASLEFPDEAHGLVLAKNQRAFFGAVFDLLDRTIGDPPAAPATALSAPR